MILITILSILSFCPGDQKYVIVSNDTMTIEDYWEKSDSKGIPCNSFVLRNGQDMNYMSDKCIPYGHWEFCDSLGHTFVGNYSFNGKRLGIWKEYGDDGNLRAESFYLRTIFDSFKYKEVQYFNGSTNEIRTMSVMEMVFLFARPYLGILFGICAFSRFPINLFIIRKQYSVDSNLIVVNPFSKKGGDDMMVNIIAFMKPIWKSEVQALSTHIIITNIMTIVAISSILVVVIGDQIFK